MINFQEVTVLFIIKIIIVIMIEADSAECQGINPIIFRHLTSNRNQSESKTEIKTEKDPGIPITPITHIKREESGTPVTPTTQNTQVTPITPITPTPKKSRTRPVNVKRSTEVKKCIEIKQSLRIRLKHKREEKASNDVLHEVNDIFEYHSHLVKSDEYARKIVELTKTCHKSQLDAFVYRSNLYFLMSWLTAVRVFGYDETNNCYNEITRIPKKYIELSSQIITSIHFKDSKLYIAYLWGSHEKDFKNSKPYIEVRDLEGNMIEKPYYYDHIVKSISSNDVFIWAITESNVIHVHRKYDIHLFPRHIDLTSFGCGTIIDASVKSMNSLKITNLQILIATHGELIIGQYDIMSGLMIKQWLTLEKEYVTVSMIQIQDKVLLHRTLSGASMQQPEYSSTIEIGCLQKFKPDSTEYFIQQISLRFKNQIIEVCFSDSRLFLFGVLHDGGGNQRYELGCLDLTTCKPLWVEHLDDADRDCHILVHDKNVILVKGRQQYCCIRIDPKTQERCQTCRINLLENAQLKHNNSHESIFGDLRSLVNKNIVY